MGAHDAVSNPGYGVYSIYANTHTHIAYLKSIEMNWNWAGALNTFISTYVCNWLSAIEAGPSPMLGSYCFTGGGKGGGS